MNNPSVFNFHNHALKAHHSDNQIWFESVEVAKALGYSNPKSVTGIYANYKKEFEGGMSKVLDSSTPANLKVRKRIFSLRGVHLIAMFARTPVAEEFRRWVLDLIDKENSKNQPATPVKRRGAYAKNNTALPCGVYHNQSKYNPYRANVWINGRQLHIGCFPTIDAASAAIEQFHRTGAVQRLQTQSQTHINVTQVTTPTISSTARADLLGHMRVFLEAAQLLHSYPEGKALAWELIAFTQDEAARQSK